MRKVKRAAFFDFDETLIDGIIEWKFFWYMVRKGKINLFKAAFDSVLLILGKMEFGKSLFREYKPYLKSLSRRELEKYVPEFYSNEIRKIINPLVLDQMIALQRKGFVIVIVTSAIDFLMQPFLNEFHIRHMESCVYKESEDLFHRNVANRIPYGKNKEIFIKKFSKNNHIDLERSYAFGNLPMDRYMLEAVGNGFFVKNGRLKKYIRRV